MSDDINVETEINCNKLVGLPFSDNEVVVPYPYYHLDLYKIGFLGIWQTIEVHGFPPTQQH